MPTPARMTLKILLPFQVLVQRTDVTRVVVETQSGSFGLLPHRLDCVAAITPGILVYETEDAGEAFVAVDEGAIVKTGWNVVVSVRNAIEGVELSELRDAVQSEFLTLNEQEQDVHAVLARMEGDFIRRIAQFHNE
ncbi:F0F1 ATP synthase subunit epsilon [Rubripirellula lacrimiformis]|uniref:F0F1 ATP synthase subunit epsilon n=1 Tax=Rubripirellula lacrimiformis TaxID=1930273 RepID=A0A517NIU3_9BACT|nr:F0F1 ATP synthase subunit epsilon [Rubripirellula lacrimiformis]QDT06963.1 F0F1 ATP synthase subunit epsilon [Rubripirellula lacrimiformis]